MIGTVTLPIRDAGKSNVTDRNNMKRRADMYAFLPAVFGLQVLGNFDIIDLEHIEQSTPHLTGVEALEARE